MRIKELFTVPVGKKITEKMFGRVLISSVCSILLCMACLISTTWAWFTVSIENKGNEIQIAKVTPTVTIKKGEDTVSAVEGTNYTLDAGYYDVVIQLVNDATGNDTLKPRRTVYVLMTVTQDSVSKNYFLVFAETEERKNCELQIAGAAAEIHFSVSWIAPVATHIDNNAVVIAEHSQT